MDVAFTNSPYDTRQLLTICHEGEKKKKKSSTSMNIHWKPAMLFGQISILSDLIFSECKTWLNITTPAKNERGCRRVWLYSIEISLCNRAQLLWQNKYILSKDCSFYWSIQTYLHFTQHLPQPYECNKLSKLYKLWFLFLKTQFRA